MTTITNFTPTPAGPFQFSLTLDGANYIATVKWNVSGQRYYITVAALDGTPIFTLPVIGSPSDIQLQSLSWADGLVTAVTELPHNFPLYQLVDVTMRNNQPDAYNGTPVEATIISANSFTYPLATDPGPPTALGTAGYDVNMALGYFTQSTLVYISSDQQFKVTP
jgi:hypothetical protein